MENAFPLIFALVAVGIILYLSYIFSRYLAVGASRINKSKHIKIIDRVVLGQDRMMFIAMIGGKYYLIGSSTHSIQILTELDEKSISQAEYGNDTERNLNLKTAFSELLSKKRNDKL